tara:strand:+ start:3801 stop:4322 length:522 start_codon:yes stop_codon:yes gene_type:complete
MKHEIIDHEIIDVVDDNNNVINQKSRSEVHKLNLKHRSAHIIVINNLNQIFIQLRSSNKKQFPNKWDISAAGHLDAGESYLKAAKRELLEELGIYITENKFQEIGNIAASENNGFEFVKIYLVKYSGDIKLEYSEIETGAWFDINILKKWSDDFPDKFSGGFADILNLYLSSY